MKKRIRVFLYSGGMLDKNFRRRIVIPVNRRSKVKACYSLNQLNKQKVNRVSELVRLFAKDKKLEDQYPFNYIDIIWSVVYVDCKTMLLGLQKDILLSDLFLDFKKDTITLVLFSIGGASVDIENGYKFVVHSNEDIHKNMPHVHVEKNGYSVRYLLETAERLEKDKISREIKRDEKKIIIPNIIKHRKELYKMWNASVNGYKTPVLYEDGKQYYDES